MRTHTDRPSAHREPRDRGTRPLPAAHGDPAPGDVRAAVPFPLTPDSLARVQRLAGNHAATDAARDGTVQRELAVQRELSLSQAARLAARLHDAMAGWGTDEEAVYGALSGRSREDIDAIKDAYFLAYDTSLRADIEDDFSGSELTRALGLLAGHEAPAAGAGNRAQEAATTARAREIAESLREAIAGLGTEEDEIFNALEGRSDDEIAAIKREYLALTHNTLEEDLADDLSGDDLRRALRLIRVADTGEFTNRITQHMTEGVTTVVRGRFRWSLSEDRLDVDVGVKFVPAKGITVPFSLWESQINSVWNQFAIREPGGRKVNVDMHLRDDPGESREIEVVQNHTPGSYGYPDRANAGMWYPVMPADTAPHEFGHLIGLPDEYQRTHGDFRAITGEDRTGPANSSGKTPEQIATQLHDALYLDDETQRAPTATRVLTQAGLISGGVPQQGDFAQDVMAAYDEEYGGVFSRELLDAIEAKVPEGSRWTLQTVFSYASGTVMGDPNKVGVQPHEHPVMPRHLREFRSIVARQWPELAWTVGPR